jgi:hypothetical protein
MARFSTGIVRRRPELLYWGIGLYGPVYYVFSGEYGQRVVGGLGPRLVATGLSALLALYFFASLSKFSVSRRLCGFYMWRSEGDSPAEQSTVAPSPLPHLLRGRVRDKSSIEQQVVDDLQRSCHKEWQADE